jgi:WD40 repeat protein
LTYQEIDGNIFYLDNSGNLYKSDPSFSSREKLSSEPFPISRENPYRLFIFQNYIFLDGNEKIYYFNQETKIFEEFSNRITSLKISPDFQKIAYFSDYEIRVLFLNQSRPPGGPGESIFLIRLSDKIKDVFWFNNDYLVFNTEKAIKACEIDNRDRVNIVDLAEMETPRIFLNQADGKLYILSQSNLSVSDKIIP